MCGLVGIAAFNNQGILKDHSGVFRDLLIADSVRGPHSTGMFSVRTDGVRFGLKTVGHPFNLFEDKRFEEYTDYVKHPYTKILAGHNRWATRGKIITENAHPFYQDHITMMHNGTLSIEPTTDKRFDVDSQAFCYSIAKRGLVETVADMQGAYAVVFYDAHQKSLNFARNSQRPLWLARNKTSKVLMWASEPDMMQWAKVRNRLSGDFELSELPINKLVSISLDNGTETESELPFTGSKLPVQSYQQDYGWQGWLNREKDNDIGEWSNALQRFVKKEEKKKGKFKGTNVIPFEPKKQVLSLIEKWKSWENSKKKAVTNFEKKLYIQETGYCTTHKIGDTIQVEPHEAVTVNSEKEIYHILCKHPGTKVDTIFKCYCVGKEMLQILLDEKEIMVTIKSIMSTKFESDPLHIVWCTDPEMVSVLTVH